MPGDEIAVSRSKTRREVEKLPHYLFDSASRGRAFKFAFDQIKKDRETMLAHLHGNHERLKNHLFSVVREDRIREIRKAARACRKAAE